VQGILSVMTVIPAPARSTFSVPSRLALRNKLASADKRYLHHVVEHYGGLSNRIWIPYLMGTKRSQRWRSALSLNSRTITRTSGLRTKTSPKQPLSPVMSLMAMIVFYSCA
jgi:hypothetical protein